MQRTEHYNLSKPERTDPFRAQDVADNLDAIDEAIHSAAESGTTSVDGMDIKPASVTATGDVADATGTLDQVRQDSKNASNITSGTLGVSRGGTGASTAAAARTNLGVTAANVVDGNAIAPASVNATGAVSGSSVSDSVGSLADLRDSVSQRFGMLAASTLGLTSTANDNLDWYWNKFGKGVCFFWVDGAGKLTNQPHGWGNAFMFIFNRNDMCQVFIDTRNKVNLRTSNSSTRQWQAWTALN